MAKKEINPNALVECFEIIEDPRVDRTKDHKLVDIIVIALCAVISGAEGWTEIEEFGLAKEEWFRSFLELEKGIPSHDTFPQSQGKFHSKSQSFFHSRIEENHL